MVLVDPAASHPLALWVVPVADVGGVARHVLDCLKEGIPGWRLVVLCPEGYLAEQLRARGAAVIAGNFGPAAGPWSSLRTLRRVISTLRPNLVHSHLSFADVVAAAALYGDRTTVLVTTEHGIANDDSIYHGSKVSAFLKARLHSLRLRRANQIIAVSQATAAAMKQKWRPSSKTSIIPNGVDQPSRSVDSSLREADTEGPRLLSLARLSSEKNIDLLLKALPLIVQDAPLTTLAIAGDGPDREKLEALASELNLSDTVRFHGVVESAEAMAGADILVQLSSWENCSYTLLDAVVNGLDVVATAVGGNPEILGPNSLIEEVTPASLAQAVLAKFPLSESMPVLPEGWPTVAQMCQGISDVYSQGHSA